MNTLMRNPTYLKLLAAQIVALSGTGLLTVGLGLLAYDLAGSQAGAVLGIAYTIKMVAYVGLSPIAQALASRLPRKAVLIGADLLRAAVALALPFVDALWQVYVLIFLLQAASATFTPAYQALLPDVLPDEEEYTRALSLSRLCYDLENLTSPALAGLLLSVVSYSGLFVGTVIGFLGSAVLVLVAVLPVVKVDQKAGFVERATKGLRIYLATPRLRGLLAVTLAGAAASAFVLVNTVVMVRVGYSGSERGLAVAMAAFGAGSMVVALALPGVLKRVSDRSVMLGATLALVALMAVLAVWFRAELPSWWAFLLLWAGIGGLYSGILTPSGRLIRRSGASADLPALFAAHFALSHVCWLITYPLAGWTGARLGMGAAMGLLAVLALGGLIAAMLLWHKEVAHQHPELSEDDPHMQANGGMRTHAHPRVRDALHPRWS
ncbi:MFS transporter [Puniceibacterium sediminis]|uniref:Predicted arabinose efflux permease, MFS family n=1 Tax=Puniceibacterium sediminis TaxID=1608407 RepID=A0A238ZBG6_9RHOB|nr:MFS transporter [Puniceibacterium sediminis]SNR80697.1 Predicted arabinose efflux permease, MFS family [Puniceibacterium sediminis]